MLRLQLPQHSQAAGDPATTGDLQSSRFTEPAAPVDATTPAARPTSEPVGSMADQRERWMQTLRDRRKRSQQVPTDAAGEPPAEPPAPSSTGSNNLGEKFVGERLLAIAGGVVLILAMAFFLRLAYENGWIKGISPELRCVIIAAVSGGLCWLSTSLRKRGFEWPAAGVGSAGLAGLYGVIYAGASLYAIFTVEFGSMLALGWFVAAAFFAWTQRSGVMATVAVIGSILAPILLKTSNPPIYAFPVHMLVLATTALVLSVLDFSKYRIAAALALGANFALGLGWSRSHWQSDPTLVIAYVCAVWLLTHLTLTRLALRAQTDDSARSLAGSTFAMGSTAWCVGIVMHTAYAHHEQLAWVAPAVFGSVCLAWSGFAGNMLNALRRRPNTSREALATLMLVQAAALLMIVTAELTSGQSAYLAWTALACGAFVAAGVLRAPGLIAYGIALACLAVTRLLMTFFDENLANERWFDSSMLIVSAFTAQAALVASAWLLGARMVVRSGRLPRMVKAHTAAALMTFVGWFVVAIGLTISQRSTPSAISALMLTAMLALALGMVHAAWRLHVAVYLTLSIAMLISIMSMWDRWASYAEHVAVHPGVVHLGIMAAGFFWIARFERALPMRRQSAIFHVNPYILPGVVFVMAFIVTSHEVSRLAASVSRDLTTRDAAVSIWWAVVGVALVVLGFVRAMPIARRTGLGLLMVAGAKVVLWDLADSDTVLRVVAMAVVGVLMIAVAIGYSRIGKLTDRGGSAGTN
ncbi:MAG: DUF2339 domain-containing protein [Phycisphaerales bacterium]|nr:DUF2339 domain-containing protein [Phycisphaerales bacterium]